LKKKLLALMEKNGSVMMVSVSLGRNDVMDILTVMTTVMNSTVTPVLWNKGTSIVETKQVA